MTNNNQHEARLQWETDKRQWGQRSVLLLVSAAFLLLLVLQGRAQLLDEHRQHLVQGVHHAALQPLGDGGAGVVEAQLLQDVVHTDGVDLPAGPGDQPAGRNRLLIQSLQRYADAPNGSSSNTVSVSLT